MVQDALGSAYQVRVQSITKNNNTRLDGLTILTEELNILQQFISIITTDNMSTVKQPNRSAKRSLPFTGTTALLPTLISLFSRTMTN